MIETGAFKYSIVNCDITVLVVTIASKDVHVTNAWTSMVLMSRSNRMIQELARQFPEREV